VIIARECVYRAGIILASMRWPKKSEIFAIGSHASAREAIFGRESCGIASRQRSATADDAALVIGPVRVVGGFI